MNDNCKLHKNSHGCDHSEHTHANKVRFYKTMVGDFTRRMGLPPKFISWCKEKLPEVIYLKGPGGDTWNIGVVCSEGSHFFYFGWKEFVTAHEIEENDTLLFKFDGGSRFTVKMFDSCECEIVSSYFVKNKHFEQESDSGCEKEERSVSPADAMIFDSSSTSSQNVGVVSEELLPVNTCQRGESSSSRKITRKGKASPAPKRNVAEERLDKNKPGKRGIRSFTVVMKAYNVSGLFHLLVPPDFARKYLLEDQVIILRILGEEEEWEVMYRTNSNDSRFMGKWRIFARANNLNVGDKCSFKLSKSKKNKIMTVHISRAVNKV